MNSKKPLVVFGAGGHALSCSDTILDAGYEIAAFVSKTSPNSRISNRWPVYKEHSSIQDFHQCDIFIAIGDNSSRWRCRHNELGEYPISRFPSIIHPSSYISPYVEIGPGCIVMQHAHVGAYARIGEFSLVNTSAVLEHECEMKEFSSLAPCSAIGGCAVIGKRSAICIGAIVIHGQVIGEDSVIGASSLVTREVPSNALGYGRPWKKIRNRNWEDRYL